MSENDLATSFKNSIGKTCIIYSDQGFRYEARILRVFADFVEFYDLKKSYKKILKLTAVKEVDFHE